MNKSLITITLGLLISTIAIGQQRVQTYKIADILKNTDTPLYLDDYTQTPEFIPLETRADCLMDIPLQIDADDKNIYVIDRRKSLFVFNHKGKFQYKIIPEGKGPGQFVKTLGGFLLFPDSQRLCIYDNSQRKLLIFNTKGEFLTEERIDIPVQQISKVGKNTLLFFTDGLYTKNAYHELSYYDISKKAFIKTIKLYTPSQLEGAQMYLQPGFTINIDETLLGMPFCDTVYRINSENCFPGYIFKLGSAGIPKEIFLDITTLEKSKENYVYISTPKETQNFLFLTIFDHGKYVFAVKNKSTGVWKTEKTANQSDVGLIYKNESKSVFQMYASSNGFYYSTINSYAFIDQFAKAFPDLAVKMKADDNPVIFRARLR